MVAKTILIADGGSTKTDWSIVSGNWEIDRIRTGGINPFFQTEEEISAEIRDNLIPRIRESDSVGAVYFYGAGCAFPEKNEIIRRSVTRYLPVPVEVGSDLLAAARALCGDSPGIACILGTGSNSCLYDGKGIVKSISPLGFVLGGGGGGGFREIFGWGCVEEPVAGSFARGFLGGVRFDTGHHYGKGL